MTDTARLDALESRLVHQDETIEDLNKVVTAQWKEIDRLTREVAMLSERVKLAEQSVTGADPVDERPPPHY